MFRTEVVITEEGPDDSSLEGETVYQVIEPGSDPRLEGRSETTQGWLQLCLIAAAVAGLGAGLFFLRKKLAKGNSHGDGSSLEGVCSAVTGYHRLTMQRIVS